ncbi:MULTISPECIES: BsuPI-related putative proteinase inhibitor [Pontibacillus]|uniref:Immunoglobulin-like domain of spore germination n=1 Tax=Pontibacillus chungwhensis TaxID=265426 RepID=A0ABY8UZ77_9BACI|nr:MULTISPECIES: BsuPI-related putative proteinase inhibitor [Pontibacillus]MCD5324716.1 BsuPI-related putative proteinase inhibitor [Pontibacillus sp. HN14]WIF98991.1 BsuPI-related putative proteinase inhibitor [Pontibacillus chungwhensis]
MKKLLVIVMAMLLIAAGCASLNESKAKDAEDTETVTGDETKEESPDTEASEETEDETSEQTNEDKKEQVDLQTLLEKVDMTATVNPEIEQVAFDFALKNGNDKAINLDFSSGQQYEILVKNENGEEVYRYSKGKSFTEAMVNEEIKPGKELAFKSEWNYKVDGKRVQPGNYTAEITVMPMKLNGQTIEAKPFQVEKSFEIPSEDQVFRNVKVEGENGQYTVTGEARVFEGSFMYNVEDGHRVLVPDTAVQTSQGAPNWGEFEFTVEISKDNLPSNGTLTLMMYEVSAKDGSVTNQKFVKLETFK